MTAYSQRPLLLLSAAILLATSNAFLPTPSITRASRRPHIHKNPSSSGLIVVTSPSPININSPSSSHPNTNSQTTSQLSSFFGLGPAELIIIAIAGLVVIGPDKLLQFSKEAGEVAGKTGTGMGDEWSEIKAIPEEFQKGVEEGEIEARSRKAKVMDDVGKD